MLDTAPTRFSADEITSHDLPPRRLLLRQPVSPASRCYARLYSDYALRGRYERCAMPATIVTPTLHICSMTAAIIAACHFALLVLPRWLALALFARYNILLRHCLLVAQLLMMVAAPVCHHVPRAMPLR